MTAGLDELAGKTLEYPQSRACLSLLMVRNLWGWDRLKKDGIPFCLPKKTLPRTVDQGRWGHFLGPDLASRKDCLQTLYRFLHCPR